MGAILESFERLARDRSDRSAVWSRAEGSVTFEALRTRARAVEPAIGAAPGELVALAAGNGAAFVELFLALLRAGAVVVSMDGSLALAEKERLCRRLGVRRLLCREDGGVPLTRGVALHVLPDVPPATAPPGTAVVKLTSGSTGDPVGVCLSEEALATGIGQIAAGMEIGPDERILVAIPMSHSYAFDSAVVSLCAIGTSLVLEPSILPRVLLQSIVEGEATFFLAVPPLVRSLGQVDWPAIPRLRVICAGGALADGAAREFHERSGRWVHQFYGATECGGIAFEPRPGEAGSAGTVGYPLPGVRVALGEDGRVEVHSKASYHGHLGRDQEAHPRVVLPGDTALWQDDGRLRLTGRTADILNVGGRKIAAAALESELLGLPGVHEAAVVGVDDPVRGDRVVAFVVCANGAGGGRDLKASGFSLGLREVRCVAALPYTERGKLDRLLLQRWVLESA